MAEKILNTRIQLKYDTYAAWTTNDPILKKGEVAIATIATGSTETVNSVTPPQVLIKVGDGSKHYSELPFASALAADVYSWAKASTKPSYSASEITGLTEYIGGVDTDTQYQLVKDDAKSNANQNVYKLQSKSKNGTFSDITGLPDITVKTDAGINSLIDAAITALNLANTYEAKGAADTAKSAVIGKASDTAEAETIYGAKAYAKDYTDQKISEIPAQTDYSVTIAETTPPDSSSNILKTYTFTQCGEKIGEINLAKDLVVTEGSVGTVTEAEAGTLYPEAKAGDKYIKLVIANQTEPIYVPANSLVDIYTGGKNTEIDVTIDGSNVITAALVDNGVTTSKIKDLNVTTSKINDGAVTEVKIATNAVTTDKIKDLNVTTAKINDSAVTEVKIATDAVTTSKIKNANVTKAKLEGAVQSSLEAADTAIQTIEADTGLTATEGQEDPTKVTIGFDNTVTFVFDCGNASGGSLQG